MHRRQRDAEGLQTTRLRTPTDLKPNEVRDFAGALYILLVDISVSLIVGRMISDEMGY
jgi:Mg-chelatase subunit ChlD